MRSEANHTYTSRAKTKLISKKACNQKQTKNPSKLETLQIEILPKKMRSEINHTHQAQAIQ